MEREEFFKIFKDRINEILERAVPEDEILWQEFLFLHPTDIAEFLSSCSMENQTAIFSALPYPLATEVFDYFSSSTKVVLVRSLDDARLVILLQTIPADELTDLFDEFSDEELSQMTVVEESHGFSDEELSQFTPVEEPTGFSDEELASFQPVNTNVQIKVPSGPPTRPPVDQQLALGQLSREVTEKRLGEQIDAAQATVTNAAISSVELKDPQFKADVAIESARLLAKGVVDLGVQVGGAVPEALGEVYTMVASAARNWIYDTELPTVENPLANQREFARRAFHAGSAALQDPDGARVGYIDMMRSGDIPGFIKQVASETAGTVPSLGAAVLGYALGGPIAAGAVGGTVEGAAEFDRLMDEGVAPRVALARAGIVGLGTAGLNALPFASAIYNHLPKGIGGSLMRILIGGTAEAVTETLEGPLSPLAESITDSNKYPRNL